MTTEKMTITRALAELKLLEKRITNSITTSLFVDVYQNRKKITRAANKKVEDFEKDARACYDSITSMIERRDDMRSGITTSNARTLVTIGKSKMTVAEAIERKRSISFKKALLDAMGRQFAGANATASKDNAQINEAVRMMLEKNLGGDKKPSEADYDAIAKPFVEANESRVADPIGLEKKITALAAEIEEFEKNVDFALSEVNARTEIDI